MASPCEVLVDSNSKELANTVGKIAHDEARRIENKFSRYLDDNIIYRINNADGEPIEVDEETAALLDYADHCYQISSGLFDITSGVLRQVWKFDGSNRIPTKQQVESVRQRIGWNKLEWQRPWLTLPRGMEIDLGGIGKEYAVDRTALLISQQTDVSFLINYGGDLFANKPRNNNGGWIIGVEQPDEDSRHIADSKEGFEMLHGGVATSGDARRYLLSEGKRYSHILNPLTGWPVEGAPRSITVLGNTCTEAGILATLAMLQGSEAERFLQEQAVKYWVTR